MNFIDYIVIAVLLIFFFKGYRLGFIGSLGWLGGLLVGIWLGGRYYTIVANWLDYFIHNYIWSSIIGFIVIIVVLVLMVDVIFRIINRVFNLLPVIGFMNRLLGGFLGIIEAVIIMGLTFWLIGLIPISNSFTIAVAKSITRPPIEESTVLARKLLPKALQALSDLKNMDLQSIDLEALKNLSNSLPTEKIIESLPLEQQQQLQNTIDKMTPEELERLKEQYNSLSPEEQEKLKQELFK